jgi:hypothetical protein
MNDLRARFTYVVKKDGRLFCSRPCSLCDVRVGFCYIDGRLHVSSGCDCASFEDSTREAPESVLDYYFDPANGFVADIEEIANELTFEERRDMQLQIEDAQRNREMIERLEMQSMPSAEELQRQYDEHYAKLANTTSHELAAKLLALPDKPMVFVVPAGGPYVHDYHAASTPWEDLMNCIRLQISDHTLAASTGG